MLLNKSLLQLHTHLKSKKISPTELLRESFSQIDRLNPKLNAFITQNDREKLLKISAKTKISSPLSGIPYVLKDAYLTKDLRTTAASNVLRNYVPPYSATLVKSLEKSGALLLGKTNQDAWGHGASTENTDFGPSRNPWDLSRVAGGSSGGVAISVSTRMSAFGIGEDTGGAIRNTAGWGGVS